MPSAESLVSTLLGKAEGRQRLMVGLAGSPGSGKSTLAANLATALKDRGETAVVVPMDGYHYDDIILNARGHRPRKGAPYTYDVPGFEHLLKRIKAREPDIAIPVFDRTLELSRAAADIIDAETRFILVEGNYLLLDEAPWSALKPLFDMTLFIEVPIEELERRLIKRWLDLGFDMAYAQNWIASNDMLNIRHILAHRLPADQVVKQA